MSRRDQVWHLLELGRHQQALSTLAPLIAEDPDDAGLHTLMAQAHIGLEQYAQALTSAREACRLDPESEHPHRLRSIALQHLDDLDEAVRAAERAVRLSPFPWQPHFQLASALSTRSRDDPRALASARTAVERAPGLADPHFMVGFVQDRAGDREAAKAAYRRALEIDPQHASALNNLGNMHLTRLGRQLRFYVSALRADPQSSVSQQNLVLVVMRTLFAVVVMSLVAADLGAIGVVATGGGGSLFGWVVGAALLLGVVVMVAAVVRAATRGVVRHVRARFRDEGALAVLSVVAPLSLAAALTLCWTDEPARAVVHTPLVGNFLVWSTGGLIWGLVSLNRGDTD